MHNGRGCAHKHSCPVFHSLKLFMLMAGHLCAGMVQTTVNLLLAPKIAAAADLDAVEFGEPLPPGSLFAVSSIWKGGAPLVDCGGPAVALTGT